MPVSVGLVLERLAPALGGLTTPQKVVVTAVLVSLAMATTTAGRILRGRIERPYLRSVVTIAVLTVLGGLGVVVTVVWEQGDLLSGALRQLPSEYVPQIVFSVGVVAVTHVLSVFAKQFVEELLAGRDGVTAHQREITYRTTQLLLWLTASIVVLGLWRIDLSGLLIGAGFLGIVLGTAARQTLGNAIAGLVLMFTRPFEVGDWIEIANDEGVVTDISILNTRLRTPDGEYVVVPNDVVQRSHVTNLSRQGRLRIEVEVGVDYDADLDHAIETTGDALSDLDATMSVPGSEVVIKRFGDSAIVLGARSWVSSPTANRRAKARTAMIDAISSAYDREGIRVPFPQRTLGTREDTADTPQVSGSGASENGLRGDSE